MNKLYAIIIVLIIILLGCSPLNKSKNDLIVGKNNELNNKQNETNIFDNEVNTISDSLYKQIPLGSKVLILDFKDLNDIITHFGKYLAEKISINISKNKSIQTIDRNNIELIIKEQQFQLSGFVSDESAVEIGKFVGASHIIFGTITEFVDFVELELKIVNVEKATVIGGVSYKIEKTQNVASLVSIIVKSEEQQKMELENQRKLILAEIEEERQKKINALKEEEKQRKNELKKIEEEIRNKSIIITEYEERKKKLQEQQNYIQKMHNEIDKLNSDVLSKLKIGMTKSQVTSVLGKNNLHDCYIGNGYVSGKYFLIFNGNILTKVVRNGSKSESGGSIVDDCFSAVVHGINIGKY